MSIDTVSYESVDACPECRNYVNYTDPTQWICEFLTSNPSGRKYVPTHPHDGTPVSCDIDKAIAHAQN
jgi:hypothetical protein